MVTTKDLKAGLVSRIPLSQLCRLGSVSLVTGRRHIANGKLSALKIGPRIYVTADAALEYLGGIKYKNNPADAAACRRMETARSGKKHEGVQQ